MSKNYNIYIQIIEEIEDLIEQKKYQESLMHINIELNKIWMPSFFEEKLSFLKSKVEDLISENEEKNFKIIKRKKSNVNFDKIIYFLNLYYKTNEISYLDKISSALENLNFIKFKKEIEFFFNDSKTKEEDKKFIFCEIMQKKPKIFLFLKIENEIKKFDMQKYNDLYFSFLTKIVNYIDKKYSNNKELCELLIFKAKELLFDNIWFLQNKEIDSFNQLIDKIAKNNKIT
ncbi:hypothetical protein [Mesomycoplasma molare]|uniref:Uncharacterized protein n=1 Tax=Mesomycoplasma molare TaxID=171288 RepID=A0ABY5TUX2_9BACT|nr:hypothetical protein [Mesomycoplasma molare]UWD34447.1 hypothetical protein NX772_01290 [Mesomycoplasma molare]